MEKRLKQSTTLAMKITTLVASTNKEVVWLSTTIIEERKVNKPIVLQVQKFMDNQSSSILIDFGSSHNLMLFKFVTILGSSIAINEFDITFYLMVSQTQMNINY